MRYDCPEIQVHHHKLLMKLLTDIYHTIILYTVYSTVYNIYREENEISRNVRNGTHLMISSTKMIKSIKLYVIIL